MGNGLPELPGPMELLDLEHGNSIRLNIERFEQGVTTIHPKQPTPRHIRLYMQQNALTEPPAPGTPISIRVPVLRVYGSRLDEPSRAPYWDITALTLQADLLPRLIAHRYEPLVVTLTANGHKPTKRYSIEQGVS
jgi:hypothetical protein